MGATAAFTGTATIGVGIGRQDAAGRARRHLSDRIRATSPRPSSVVSGTVSAVRVAGRQVPGASQPGGDRCDQRGLPAGGGDRRLDVRVTRTCRPSRSPSAAPLPAFWLEPHWAAIPRQKTPEEQLRYALLRAPREDWAPAWLAVAGLFPAFA